MTQAWIYKRYSIASPSLQKSVTFYAANVKLSLCWIYDHDLLTSMEWSFLNLDIRWTRLLPLYLLGKESLVPTEWGYGWVQSKYGRSWGLEKSLPLSKIEYASPTAQPISQCHHIDSTIQARRIRTRIVPAVWCWTANTLAISGSKDNQMWRATNSLNTGILYPNSKA
jgi:hypothetical protein